MQLRLKTKITLTTAALVLAVVGVNSTLYVMNLTRQVIRQAEDRARLASQQVFFQTQVALADAARAGKAPEADTPKGLRDYAQKALNDSTSLADSINAQLSYSKLIYEISISDVNGIVLVSSDKNLPGNPEPVRSDITQLIPGAFTKQLKVLYRLLYGPPSTYEVTYPFELGRPGNQVPFGAVRVAVQTGLLRASITPALRSAALLALASVGISVLLAAIVSSISLAPLERITAQLDRIAKGETDQPLQSGDEFGQVSTKISQIGMQLRGVREIFSNLRENIDQVLGGLDDGLLLFSVDGRAVMVSPAVERFLSMPADQLLGRRAEDIFPPDHAVREAIKVLPSGEFEPVASAEVVLAGIDGPARRVDVSVEVIGEGDQRMGTLVKFKDLESRERIGTQLQVSERLANLGRITAGVAHEVKNPLNSMRIWLENLKASLPDVDGLPLQAVRVLDTEIDRLDSVVKRFLDFTRPPEMHQEESSLKEILEEVLTVERPEFAKCNIRLETHLDGDVPYVWVDKPLLRQGLINLLVNAIEAMPGGGQLFVGLRRHSEMAEIEIRDTGKGIAPEHRQRIFQLFFTTRPGGSGIGLASTFRTVQLHNGSIEFDSEVGRGTTFRISLPLAHQLESVLTRHRDPGAAVARSI